MNYDRYAADPIHSPMFNGNASSMGGNGAFVNYTGVPQPFRKPYDHIPPADGGGCVTEGPFKECVHKQIPRNVWPMLILYSMNVSIGPKAAMVPGVPKNPQDDGLGSNPRCLRRDVNKYSAAGATANYTYSLIMDNKDIDSFYNRYLGQPPLKNDPHPWGVSRREFQYLDQGIIDT